jgi:hypothetical protein
MAAVTARVAIGRRGRHLCGRRHRFDRALDQLVEFAAIELHTPAAGAEVDLDVRSFRHRQRRFALRAEHKVLIV